MEINIKELHIGEIPEGFPERVKEQVLRDIGEGNILPSIFSHVEELRKSKDGDSISLHTSSLLSLLGSLNTDDPIAVPVIDVFEEMGIASIIRAFITYKHMEENPIEKELILLATYQGLTCLFSACRDYLKDEADEKIKEIVIRNALRMMEIDPKKPVDKNDTIERFINNGSDLVSICDVVLNERKASPNAEIPAEISFITASLMGVIEGPFRESEAVTSIPMMFERVMSIKRVIRGALIAISKWEGRTDDQAQVQEP